MQTKSRRWMILPLAILILSLAGIVLGVVEKEHLTVLQKSTVICLECIGLG